MVVNKKKEPKEIPTETESSLESSSENKTKVDLDEDLEKSLLDSEAEKTQITSSKEKINKKWYRKFKMPSSLAIIFGIILFVIVLTWVIPHPSYAEVTDDQTGEFIHWNSVDGYTDLNWYGDGVFGLGFLGNGWFVSSSGHYGILDIPMLLFVGFLDAAGVIIFVLAIGMFIEIMMASKTLEAGVVSLEKKMKGKELLLIPILFILFSLGGSTYGMQEETIGFFPIIVPFLILAGFDSMTGFLVVVMGTTTGIAASTVNPFSIGAFTDGLTSYTDGSGNEISASMGTGLVTRLIIWIIFTIVGAVILTYYAHRVKKNKKNSIVKNRYDEDIVWARDKFGVIEGEDAYKKLSRTQAIALWIFGFTFFIMIFGMLPWESWNVDMDIWLSWIFFGSILLGQWFYIQLIILFTMSAIILGLIFKMKPKEIRHSMYVGAKSMFGVAIIIGVARTIAIVLVYSGVNDAMVKQLLEGIGGTSGVVFVTLLFPIFIFLALFIPSTSGLAGATAPILGPIIVGMSGSPDEYLALAAGVMLSYSLAVGIVNMFTPSNAIIFAQAESANLDYGTIIKPLLAYALVITILSLIVIPTSVAITL